MGGSNVTRVFTEWTHLGHREIRLLAYMAAVSLDQDKPPVYFGGWEAGAMALGLDCIKKASSSAEQYRRVVSQLKRSGAIVSDGKARYGNAAEYALTLDPLRTVRPNGTTMKERTREDGSKYWRRVTAWAVVHREDPRSQASPTESVPRSPTESVPQQTHRNSGFSPTESVPPRRTQEQGQEQHQDAGVSVEATTSLVPVDNSAKADEIPESVYGPASQFLGARPDLGQTFLDQARTLLGQDADRRVLVVKAAEIAGWTPPKEVAA